jgi:hypothetical protein
MAARGFIEDDEVMLQAMWHQFISDMQRGFPDAFPQAR